MINNSLNKEWKLDFFKIFATSYDVSSEYEKADKLKFEHFPPVLANFYNNNVDVECLKNICNSKLKVKKAKLDSNYNPDILKINFIKTIKTQLNALMQDQINKLQQEDPTFLSEDEKEIIAQAEFPFIKLMTLVYSKDTDEMTPEDQEQWKTYMSEFINQQIVFGVINTYFTMKLYQDNNYVKLFQTPYNKEEVWDKDSKNKGFCVVYDFKEIKEVTAKQLNKIYPVLYSDKKLTRDDFDYDIFNAHCASIIRVNEEVSDYDSEWMYILNHHYTETEYRMLENLLEPIYSKTTNDESIQNILKNNYLVNVDDELEYKYEEIINDLAIVLESKQLHEKIKDDFEKVLDITEDYMEIDFMKPEAIYLGTQFPDEKVTSFKELIEAEGVRIFKIKEKDGKLFKALV